MRLAIVDGAISVVRGKLAKPTMASFQGKEITVTGEIALAEDTRRTWQLEQFTLDESSELKFVTSSIFKVKAGTEVQVCRLRDCSLYDSTLDGLLLSAKSIEPAIIPVNTYNSAGDIIFNLGDFEINRLAYKACISRPGACLQGVGLTKPQSITTRDNGSSSSELIYGVLRFRVNGENTIIRVRENDGTEYFVEVQFGQNGRNYYIDWVSNRRYKTVEEAAGDQL